MTSDKGIGAARHPAGAEELRREFILADRDRDGRIDMAEFAQLLDGLRADMSTHDMQIGFRAIDTDHDGRIDRQEFMEWWTTD